MYQVSRFVLLLASLFCSFRLIAQSNGHNLSLKELLTLSETNYPAIKSKGYQLQASEVQVSISKNSIMPSLDAALQSNYATHNN